MRTICCFCFCMVCISLSAQEVQSKIFIIDENYYAPQAELKVASICFGSVDSSFISNKDYRELPIGLLSISNSAIRYSMRDGKIISASFLDSRNVYRGGPAITANEPDKMQSLNDREVKQFIEDYGFTYHGILGQTMLDGLPLRKAVFENSLEELIFDFAVTEGGSIFCFLILRVGLDWTKSILQTWKLLDGNEELITWEEHPKGTDWPQSKAELVASLPLPEKMEEMTTFSQGNQLFIFSPVSGKFYQFSESGFKPIQVELEGEKTYLDSTLVIDKDTGKVFLLSKSILKEKKESFRAVVEQHGVEVSLLK